MSQAQEPPIPRPFPHDVSPGEADQGVSIDIQDVIDDMKNQISELNYQNMLLRLTLKKFQ
jgi:hypothetical protein